MHKVLLVAALIIGLGFSGLSVPLSGSWEMDITFDPRVPITGLGTILTIDYTISEWTFRSVSRLGGGTGWYRQDFLAEGTIGAFEFTNRLRFVPAPDPAFTFLRSTVEVSIAGVDLSSRFLIVGPTTRIVDGVPVDVPAGSGFRLGFSAPASDLTFSATAYFCSLAFDPPPVWDLDFDPPVLDPDPWAVVQVPTHTSEFRGLDVDIAMPFYSTKLTIDIDFVPYPYPGFQDITFTVPRFPLGITGFALDLKVKYTLEKQEVAVTPHITLRNWLLFEPFISIKPPCIDGLILEGLRLEWDATDAVRFRYHFDARPNIEPNVVRGYGYCPDEGCPHKQMVELRYKAAPITLTMAGFWYSWWGVAPFPLPTFPNWIDINLAINVLPGGFTVRTGLYFECATLAFMTFGFIVTW